MAGQSYGIENIEFLFPWSEDFDAIPKPPDQPDNANITEPLSHTF